MWTTMINLIKKFLPFGPKIPAIIEFLDCSFKLLAFNPFSKLQMSYYPLEKRKLEWQKLREKYPDRIPIIWEKFGKSNLEELVKEK